MATFLSLQQNVSADLDDTSNARFTLAKVKRYLNQGRRLLFARAKLAKKESVALAGAATTPTYAWYTLPSDFLELDESEQGGVWNNGLRVYPANQGCLGDTWATQTGTPSHYLRPTGANPTALRLWPYNTVALTALTIFYAYQPTDMSADADTSLLPQELDMALEWYALGRCLEAGDDAEQRLAAQHLARFESAVEAAIAKTARGSSSEGAVVRYRHV